MTHIRGEIEKVYEIQKDAFTQPIVGGRIVLPYSFAFNIPAGTSFFNIDSPPLGTFHNVIQLHSINITCVDTVNIQRIYFILYPAGTVLGDFYFYFRYMPRQFFLGDVQVDLTGGNYVRVYVENNAGANRYFEGTIWYMGIR